MIRNKKSFGVPEVIEIQIETETNDQEVALRKVLAYLRALYLNYQNSHWLAAGDHATHLLFERLYTSLTDEMDSMAEKLIGVCGFQALNPCKQMEMINGCLAKWEQIECFYGRGTEAETEFLDLLKGMRGNIQFSEGVCNLLDGIADVHEGNIYLLKR